MVATLSAVAMMANLIIKRENDFCRLRATRFAIKSDTFKKTDFSNL
jgi:hypothetical protein